jgi:hypothetical protein
MKWMRRDRLWLAAMLLVLRFGPAQAQVPVPEAAVKAAYLHKFPGYVEWPPGVFNTKTSAVVVGVVGADSVLAELTQIAFGHPVQGRPVEARAVARGALPRDLNILFIGRDAAADATALMAELRDQHVLVVTEMLNGLTLGAALNCVVLQGRVRFEASMPAAESAGLKLSSGLLRVASRVVEAAP